MQNPGQATTPKAPIVARPSANEYYVLKAREKELNHQLEDVQDRRSELTTQLEQSPAAEQPGIQARVSLLDTRLQQIETDLGDVGRQLAATAPATTAQPAPIVHYRGYNEDAIWTAGFMGAGLMLAMLAPFLWRTWRRRGRHDTPTPMPALRDDRADRMEHAIDAIAVEMERVSENQRFMTRLLTETQLAGTIAAVRGSAEAAKAAAEIDDRR